MADTTSFVQRVDEFVDTFGDPYGNVHLPGAPWKIMFTVAAYLVFVLKVGPAFMRNRKPLQVEGPMRLYNVLNVLANVTLLCAGLHVTNFMISCWSCTHMSELVWPPGVEWLAVHGYMNLKVLDMMDTVFFVLRKKDSQVTLLHLVHHSILPITCYFGMKLAPFTPSMQFGILNAFVHVVMYSYYFLASYGPKMQPYLWWKKYITEIQLIQFAIILIHATTLLAFHEVPYPKVVLQLQLLEAGYFMYAFGQFYVKSYKKGTSKKYL